MNINLYRVFFEVQKKHWWFVAKKDIILDTISRWCHTNHKMKVLDIGCGSGLMLNSLEKVGHTFGMDMSDDAIGFSKEIFDGRVEKGLLPDQIPYDDNFFDLIIALDVIEHVDQDVESLISMRSCLKSDGTAIITVPAYMFLWSRFDELNEHKRRYSIEELKSKLLQAGFKIDKISYYNTLLFPIVCIVRFSNKLLKRDGSSDTDLPNKPVNSILRFIFGIEKYLLRFANLPFGVSLIAVVKK